MAKKAFQSSSSNSASKKRDWRGGVNSLLNNIESELSENQEEVIRELSSIAAEIPLEQIERNPDQPRKDFDEAALQELASSIKTYGIIQPLTVRRLEDKRYQLISGERRLRASKLAGLEVVPAYIRLANDQEMMEMALVENIQRSDLNAVEIATTYQRLIEEFSFTHEQLSERVGKERSTVTNYLGLLDLPPDIKKALKEERISMGHARALKGIDDLAVQLSLFKKTLNEQLSVRALEQLVSSYKASTNKGKPKPSRLPDAYAQVQRNLQQQLGAKVQLKVNNNGKGQIVIPFTDNEDLNRLLELLDN